MPRRTSKLRRVEPTIRYKITRLLSGGIKLTASRDVIDLIASGLEILDPETEESTMIARDLAADLRHYQRL